MQGTDIPVLGALTLLLGHAHLRWVQLRPVCVTLEHWQIQGGRGYQGCVPPWDPNSVIFTRFSEKKHLQNNINSLEFGAPPP